MNKRGESEVIFILAVVGFIFGAILGICITAAKIKTIDSKSYIRLVKPGCGFGWYELGDEVQIKQVAEVVK